MQAKGLDTHREKSSGCKLRTQTPMEEPDRREQQCQVEAEEEAAQVEPRRQQQRPQMEVAGLAAEAGRQQGHGQSGIARSVQRPAS